MTKTFSKSFNVRNGMPVKVGVREIDLSTEIVEI
jgi:hypothetical protein